jgi:hypothetical protein
VPLAVQYDCPPPKPPSGGPPGPPSPIAPEPPQHAWLSPPQGEPLVSVHDPAVQVPETPVPLQA